MSVGIQHGLFDDELKDQLCFNLNSFLVSDYLLVCKLLEGYSLSSFEANQILSTRITNHTKNIRKILGFNSIQNILIPTTSSYYEQYKINEAYRDKFIKLKAFYEANKIFMYRVNHRLELEKRGGNV